MDIVFKIRFFILKAIQPQKWIDLHFGISGN